MFESLQDRLEGAFKNLKGEGRITDLNIASTIKEIRRALVDADVNYKIAKEFTDTVKDKAVGEKVINAISPSQLMVKIVKDELVNLMGGEAAAFNAKGAPAVILIAGLQGSGKTTFSGKLSFDPKQNNFWPTTQTIKQIQNGDWVTVWPRDRAAGQLKGPAT